MPTPVTPSAAALAVAVVSGLFAFSAASGLTVPLAPALAGAAVVGGLIGWVTWRRLLVSVVRLDESASSRALAIVSLLATVLAVAELARLTLFMVDPSRTDCSVLPFSPWQTRHSCLSAYHVAAEEADRAPNVYEDSLYSQPSAPTAPRKARELGIFRVDVYEYPPPFLLLPRALHLVAPDFLHLRMLWFGLVGGVVLLGTLVVAGALGRVVGTRALLLSPLVWASLPTLAPLQMGNVQLVIIVMSVLGMLLFHRGRWAAGGALLAFATVSKLFPGVLLVYLLVRRAWRPLAWTVGFCIAFVVAGVLDTGWAPWTAFLGHLPGLVGGESFPAFRIPAAIAINYSVPGIIFKLGLFDVAGMSFAAAKVVGWLYTAVLLWLTVTAGRRATRDGDGPLAWLALLILASLRSPFLPQAYAAFPPLWLLTLLAAARPPTGRTLVLFVAAWLVLNVYIPTDSGLDPRLVSLIVVPPQILTIVLAVRALRPAR